MEAKRFAIRVTDEDMFINKSDELSPFKKARLFYRNADAVSRLDRILHRGDGFCEDYGISRNDLEVVEVKIEIGE